MNEPKRMKSMLPLRSPSASFQSGSSATPYDIQLLKINIPKYLAIGSHNVAKFARNKSNTKFQQEFRAIKNKICAAKAYSIASDMKLLQCLFVLYQQRQEDSLKIFFDFRYLILKSVELFNAVAMNQAAERRRLKLMELENFFMIKPEQESARSIGSVYGLSESEHSLTISGDSITKAADFLIDLGDQFVEIGGLRLIAERVYFLALEATRIGGEVLAFVEKYLKAAASYSKYLKVREKINKLGTLSITNKHEENYIQNGYIRYEVYSRAARSLENPNEIASFREHAGDGILDCFSIEDGYIEKSDGTKLVASYSTLAEMGTSQYRLASEGYKGVLNSPVKDIGNKINEINKALERYRNR